MNRPSPQHVQTPDAPGRWWFEGTITVPFTPDNACTVHLARPRELELIQTQWGLVPVTVDNPMSCLAHCQFDGWWLQGSERRKQGQRCIPRELLKGLE